MADLDPTARTVRLVMAQALRDAAVPLAAAEPIYMADDYDRGIVAGFHSAARGLIARAEELERTDADRG